MNKRNAVLKRYRYYSVYEVCLKNEIINLPKYFENFKLYLIKIRYIHYGIIVNFMRNMY